MKYPIRTVSKMTGLGIDTLRAWERRYDAVHPRRDERGRLYSDADVQRLRLLRDAVANGHAIGRAARFDPRELRDAAAPTETADTLSRRVIASVIDVHTLIDAVDRFDAAFIESELGRAATLLGPRALLQDVILPTLRTMGDRWSAGRASVAHEHLLSAVVRGVLGSLLRGHGRTDTTTRIVFATPSSELHELGALGAAALAASGGLGVVYLGPNLPADEIVRLVGHIDTDAVVLGVTAVGEARVAVEREVRAIAAGLPRDIELWLGGAAAARLGAALAPRALALRDYDDLIEQLQRLGARF